MTTNESTVDTLAQTARSRARQLWSTWTAPGAIFYASTMAANAVGYLFFFVMARILTVPEYGELVTLTALVYVFGVITRSMQAKAAQAVTSVRNTDVPASAAGAIVLRQIAMPLLVGTALLVLLGALASSPVAAFLRLDSLLPVILLGAYVATHFLLSGPRGVLLGSGRLYYLSWVTILDPVVRLGVALVLVHGAHPTSGALLGYVAGNLVAAIVASLPFLVKAIRGLGQRIYPKSPLMTYDRQFVFALAINAALMAFASVDPVAIRRYFSETVAGTYSAAFLLGRIILLSTNAVSWVIFSRTVHLRRNDPRARTVLLRGLAVGGASAGAVTAAYWIAPDLAARAMGGEAFEGASRFVGLVGIEMTLFTFISILAYYHIAIRNTRLLLPFLLAFVAEVAVIVSFHNTPVQILLDSIFVLTGLLIWIGLETMRALQASPALGSQPARACMVVHSHYPSDPRVRRETEALREAGWQVDVICVPDEGQAPYEVVDGVRVYRMPVTRNRMGSQVSYLLEYARFFVTASWRLARLHLQRPYQVVQIHNMPDFLVFTGLVPRLLGARIVLDVHDLVPEFYALRYRLPLKHPLVRLARWVQKLSARFAHHVLTAGAPFRRQLIQNGVPAHQVTSIMNSPDPQLFTRQGNASIAARNGHFVLSYHGSLSEYNDLELVLRAVARLRHEIPGLEFRIYGRGRSLPQLQALAEELKLNGHVKFLGFRPLDEMPELIADAHLGIVPQTHSAFTALNFPTKAFEYIALGVPVLMSRSPALEEVFGQAAGSFFQPGDPEQLVALIRQIYTDPERAQSLVNEQQRVCGRFAWEVEKQRYVQVMQELVAETEKRVETVPA